MDLYLSNCLKAAEAAASKAASGSLKTSKESCSTGKQKPAIPNIGPSSLLDLPLGAKLPVIPGSTNIFYTTNISETLYQPSFGFNLSDPYCKLMETTYKSLHDPHLKAYFKRKDILKKLKKGGYITGNNKVICSLKELNKYRQYLTTLKIDFERNYIREQKIIENQVNKLNEEKRACDDAAAAEFQQWLLQEGKKPSPHQNRLIKLRHLRMINKELDKIENTSGRRNTLQLKEEDRQHWDNVRRKLSLRKQVEEDWQFKEMSLLTKIGEEVRKESKVEEHRRKIRDEINRKKQVMLHKRIAYHLQKMQKQNTEEEQQKASIFEEKQTEAASSVNGRKPSVSEHKLSQEHLERKPSTSSVRTSTSDQRLLQESRESKSSQFTKASFDEQKSFYELLESKFFPMDKRASSLPGEQSSQEFLEPKHYHYSSAKKTSFADETLPQEPTEQKHGPASSKRASFVNQKFMDELLEAKYLYPNYKRASVTDQKQMEESKSPPNAEKTNYAEDKSFQQLMDAITPPQYLRKTSYTEQKSSQESLGSRRSSIHSQNSFKVFMKSSSTSLPEQRDIQNTTEQKYDKETARTSISYNSFDKGNRKVSVPVPGHLRQAAEASRQSYLNIPKQETNTPFQNTHKK